MDDLFKIVRTKDEANKLIEELDALLASVYEQKGEGFDWALKNKVRYWVASFLANEIAKSEKDKVLYLEDLKGKLSRLRILELGIAYEPSDEMLDRLAGYARKIFGSEILLEINYIPGILGGARIIYEGNFYDFSIKKAFEQEFSKNKGGILNKVYQEVGKDS